MALMTKGAPLFRAGRNPVTDRNRYDKSATVAKADPFPSTANDLGK